LGTSADHYYAVAPAPGQPAPSQWLDPPAVVNQWKTRHDGDRCPMVVVTATGGGILAAAWTAEGLTRLKGELKAAPWQKGDDAFGSSIILISSVSGGSVGTMYFAEELAERGDPSPLPNGCDSAVSVPDAARTSSLREAAWGLAYPDTLRVALPLAAG